ncbi:MAG: pseudouridine synthase [Candidatus Babeliales bacterium]
MAQATTLVKYLAAHAGHSRRTVTDLIKEGKVTVNGSIIKEPWLEVSPGDDIRLEGKKIVEGKKVYFLLNKPTGFITTMEDNLGREDVSLLMKGATRERIFPIGRLDRDTTGLLVFTNDGELAQQLSHPRFNMKKEYMVTLDKPVNPEHLKLMFKGLFLKDGKARADRAVLVPGKRKYVAIIEIHSGKKHIIRRMFEHFGYEVRQLDRIDYAGLNKKGLALGKWRALTEEEITSLKTMAQEAAKKARKPRTGAKRPAFNDKQRKPSGRSFGAGLEKKSRFKRTDRPDIRKKKERIIGTEEWFNQDDVKPQEPTRRERSDSKAGFRRSDSHVKDDYSPKRPTRSHKDRQERASWQEKPERFDIESWFNEGDDERPTRSRTRFDAIDTKPRTRSKPTTPRKKSTAVSTKPAFKRTKPGGGGKSKSRTSGKSRSGTKRK